MHTLKVRDSARLIGTIRYGDHVYVAQGTVLRSEGNALGIGNDTWILENSVVVGWPEQPTEIGSKTVFGHKCLVMGAQIGNLCEIGNGTLFLPGSRLGNRCITGEGTLIPAGTVIPDESVVVGRPGRVIRKLTEEDRAMIKRMRGGNTDLRPVSITETDFGSGEGEKMGKTYAFAGKTPRIDDTASIYDTAEITGDVIIGKNTLVASGVRIIGDSHGPVRIGNNVQILENTVLHLLPDNELVIDDDVVIGPGCMIHGTTIGACSVIESGAIVCDYSQLGKNTLVRSGSLVKQRSVFGEGCILEGFPAQSVGSNEGTLEKPPWARNRR